MSGDAKLTYDEAIAALAECYRLSGADTDGDEDWRLAPRAVEAVRQLRANYDELLKEAPVMKVVQVVHATGLRDKIVLGLECGHISVWRQTAPPPESIPCPYCPLEKP